MQATPRSHEQIGAPTRTFAETARRAQIVEAAIEIAATRGFANTSFAAIAKAAGLSSTGIISYHFAGKDDLVREMIDQVWRAAEAYVVPRVEAAAGARARLRAYIEAHTAFLEARPHHLPALIEVMASLPRDGAERDRFDARLDDAENLRARLIREGQAAGEFRAFDARILAMAVQGGIDAIVRRKSHELGLDAAACGRELAEIFDRATRKPEEA